MLTKDLLRFQKKQGKVIPQFIDINQPDLVEIANDLLSFYNPENSPKRNDITELCSGVINSCKNIKIAAGLNKLIQDRCSFSCANDYDYLLLRQQVFTQGSKILQKQQNLSYKDYRDMIVENTDLPDDFLNNLYADHPDNEILIKTNLLSTSDLLNRYNLSLVQSLLLYANEISIEIYEKDQGKLRQFFKYLKFFRLLAEIIQPSKNSQKLKITISGPLSVIDNSKKYGLQIASFFPAICNLTTWKIETKIKLSDWSYPCRLILDQQAPLKPIYHQFSAYIPEEIKLFHEVFKEKSSEWKIAGHTPFIKTVGGEIIFPDLSFLHSDGTLIHLELFHLWHQTAFERRLKWLEKNPTENLLIGIDKRILNEKSPFCDYVTNNSFFQTKGFIFRDFPTISKILTLLNLHHYQT